MRIGYFGGTVNEGTIDDVVDEARQAEADGFASYWAPNIFGHDALTVLAIVGREVPRIELGTSVVPTFPRHPFAIAQQCLTVSAASGGRLTLGIGLSHKIVIENMMGLSYDKPIRHIRDYLGILGPLVFGELGTIGGIVLGVRGQVAQDLDARHQVALVKHRLCVLAAHPEGGLPAPDEGVRRALHEVEVALAA